MAVNACSGMGLVLTVVYRNSTLLSSLDTSASPPSPPSASTPRAFEIQLNGERHRGIRLRFSRREHHREMRTPKGMPRERSDCRVRYASWFVSLFENDDASKGIEAPLGDVSLLTGRMTDEIKAARINEIKGTVERMRLREHQEAAEIWEAFGLSNLEQGMDDAEWETLPKELGEPGRGEGDDGRWIPDWQSRGGEEGWQRDWQSQEGDGLETPKYDLELWDKA